MNDELRSLFDEDQADREGGVFADPTTSTQRDCERRARVTAILDAGGARSADDHYWAAMVFQHGGEVASYRRAHDLAMRAVTLDPGHSKARWLAAAALDRELVARGQLQLYGTQFFVDDDGRWSLQPVDPSVTDEERARWNVPPLEAARQRVRDKNRR